LKSKIENRHGNHGERISFVFSEGKSGAELPESIVPGARPMEGLNPNIERKQNSTIISLMLRKITSPAIVVFMSAWMF
jgi:hypothetical protein